MDALVFTWSGSFRDEFEEQLDEIAALVHFVRDRFDMEAGVLSTEDSAAIEAELDVLSLDFVVGEVEDIVDVVGGLTQRYDHVFFVSDVRAELASVNQTGAFTIGYNSDDRSAEELGGIGPNYIVDGLDEVHQILALEHMPDA